MPNPSYLSYSAYRRAGCRRGSCSSEALHEFSALGAMPNTELVLESFHLSDEAVYNPDTESSHRGSLNF